MLLSIGFEKYKAEHDSIFFYFSLTAVYPLVGTRVLLPSVSSGGFGALPCPFSSVRVSKGVIDDVKAEIKPRNGCRPLLVIVAMQQRVS